MTEDKSMEEVLAEEAEHHAITVNQVASPRDPVEMDIGLRLSIINVLHATGWTRYEEEAVDSLRNAHAKFFRDDS